MNDDYLWDRSGEPDPELAHLEEVLGTLRWSKTDSGRAWTRRLGHPYAILRFVAAAAVIVGIAMAVLLYKVQTGSPTSWQLSVAGEKPKPMRTGQLVETTGNTRGTIESEFVGRVDIEPASRLRLLAASENEQRLALDHGTIHALIWAPPTRFVVDTPAAKTVDLGCEYTLHVGNNGDGLLSVEMGWVAFEWHGLESFIPAGAACRTRPGHGPDTPYFVDAPAEFKNAIAAFDLNGNRQALEAALGAARQRDGLTLWHLLQRTHGDERGEVFDRFTQLLSLPKNVSRAAILRGDKASMDAAWDALQLGNTGWWR